MSKTTKKKTVPATATVYVHEYENRVLSPKDFRTEMICRAADLQSDEDFLSDWLTDKRDLSPVEIFNLTEAERTNLRQEYDEYCVEAAKEELLDDWTEIEVEVEVEIED